MYEKASVFRPLNNYGSYSQYSFRMVHPLARYGRFSKMISRQTSPRTFVQSAAVIAALKSIDLMLHKRGRSTDTYGLPNAHHENT